ncbi:MAG: hypothetical protein ACJAS4_002871 [Bacteriovoracaceae bacterium]|jgi:hypothetical protein
MPELEKIVRNCFLELMESISDHERFTNEWILENEDNYLDEEGIKYVG